MGIVREQRLPGQHAGALAQNTGLRFQRKQMFSCTGLRALRDFITKRVLLSSFFLTFLIEPPHVLPVEATFTVSYCYPVDDMGLRPQHFICITD